MRAIIIDASVAGSAGGTAHPTSVICRQTLVAMLNATHKLVMTRKMAEEWQTHASYRAKLFLAEMTSRRKVVSDVSEDESLYPLILSQVTPQTIPEEAVSKDLHLIGAALATENRIISLDKKVRRFMDLACEAVTPLQSVIWLHPIEHDAPQWLEKGAMDMAEYHLCYTKPTND